MEPGDFEPPSQCPKPAGLTDLPKHCPCHCPCLQLLIKLRGSTGFTCHVRNGVELCLNEDASTPGGMNLPKKNMSFSSHRERKTKLGQRKTLELNKGIAQRFSPLCPPSVSLKSEILLFILNIHLVNGCLGQLSSHQIINFIVHSNLHL